MVRTAVGPMQSGKTPSVSDAATAAGIAHLGRFATEYRRRFGELPSQTLVRGRSR
jgi:AraC-like DNA-binding protein